MTDLYLHGLFALGGGLGAVLRHWIAQAITHDLPVSTLVVNVMGSLLLGAWIANLGGLPSMGEEERQLVFGFCGGFTTFSSFAYQTLKLHRDRSVLTAAGNIGLSLILCGIGFWLGLWGVGALLG
ncbi:CrcB family protein (plasmid) [Rhodobacteraceae bacterium M382]|nr:CrcB family protein [Rhodobacteraceae bacterium M382]